MPEGLLYKSSLASISLRLFSNESSRNSSESISYPPTATETNNPLHVDKKLKWRVQEDDDLGEASGACKLCNSQGPCSEFEMCAHRSSRSPAFRFAGMVPSKTRALYLKACTSPLVKNARLSSSVPKARPGTVTQTQNAGEAVSTLSAQQGGARPSNQEAASDSGAQVQPDQPPPDDLENAGKLLSDVVHRRYQSRFCSP